MSPYADTGRRTELRLASDRKRTGSKPWHPGGPGRPPKNRGATMHEWDDDTGLCTACGAKRTTFAPRPELRAAAPSAPGVPAPAPPPPKAKAKSLPSRPRAKESKPAERIGDTTFDAIVAALQDRRARIDELILRIREIQQWWPERLTKAEVES